MKRIVSILVWFLLTGAIVTGIAILTGLPPVPELGSNDKKSSQPGAETFAAFPLDQPRSIDFDIDDSTASQLTARELTDQKRDWLIYTIASASGLPASAINRGLFDLAPVRHSYLDQVSHFEYGQTRSFCFDEKRVIALVPRSDALSRQDDLAHVFDEARKNLGTVPEIIEPFEYTLDGGTKGTITRRKSIAGSYFLSQESGYREVAVSSAPELKEFMGSVDDLVFARMEEQRLRLGGRKFLGMGYQNITVEDVAAIWQSEQTIHTRLQEFNDKWERLAQELHDKYRSDYSQSRYNIAFQALQKAHDAEQEQLKLVNGSGFSLDPTYDYAGLAATLAKPTLAEVLRATQWTAAKQLAYLNYARELVSRETTDAEKTPARNIKNNGPKDTTLADLLRLAGFPDPALGEVVDALSGRTSGSASDPSEKPDATKPDVLPFLRILDQAKNDRHDGNAGAALLADIFQGLDNQFQYQKARYDGPLRGTEAGMVLFYTDLLAKLWAIDYLKNSPAGAINEFEPLTRTILPAAYRAAEISLPSIRLWFGPEDNGYQLVGKSAIGFARNATRIYAASSNPLEPGKETEPTASANAFLGWWNNHYEEVAAYEPQYRRLNEIMKWSLVIGWLNQSSSGNLLQYLSGVSVNRSAWFPDWVRQKGDLRFRDWNNVHFFPRSYLGSQTEAMPILFSEDHRKFADEDPADPQWMLSGGVSLASKDLLEARTALSEAVPQVLRRSGLDYGKSATGTMDELVTTRGIRYHFDDQVFGGETAREFSSTTIIPKEGLKFRGRYGDLRNGKMERIVSRSGDLTEIEARTASGEIGSLSIAEAKNGFRIGWHAREVDDGFTIARRLSSTPDFDRALKTDPLVEFAIKDASGVYYVKSLASHKWMKLASEGKNLPDISGDWDGRVCDLTRDAKPVNVSWVDGDRLPPEVRSGGNWVRGPPPPNDPESNFVWSDDDANESGKGFTWKETAQDIAKDPLKYKQHRDELFTNRLKEIDRLMAEQQTLKAVSLIDDGLFRFGDHEAFRLRQAFAELDRGRKDAMLDSVNAMRVEERSQAEALIVEINARLQAGQGGDESLYRIAEGIDWKTSPSKPFRDEVILSSDKEGKLVNDLRFDALPSGTTVLTKDIPPYAHVYCENAPGLNQIDWNSGMQRALDQIAGRQLGEIIALPRGDIAHFDPAHLLAGDRRFSRVAGNPQYTAAHANPTLAIRYVPWIGNAANHQDDDRKKKNQGTLGDVASSQQVFLIVSRQFALAHSSRSNE